MQTGRCLVNSNLAHSTGPCALAAIIKWTTEICHTKTRIAANQKSKLPIDCLEPFTQAPEQQTLLNGGISRGEATITRLPCLLQNIL